MCMLCNCVWQSCTVNDSTCGFMSCLSSLLPTVICSRDNQVEKHTGPLPHSSDGSNDKIEVYRNHFTVLPKELKHIQIKAEIQSSINNRTNGWKKKKAEIAQMCTLFLFINHDNNVLKDFCVFSWAKQKRKTFDFIVCLSVCFLQCANKKENQCQKTGNKIIEDKNERVWSILVNTDLYKTVI